MTSEQENITIEEQLEKLKSELSVERDRLNYITGYFGQLIESIAAGIIITDEDLFITDSNNCASRLLNVAKSEIEGSILYELIPAIKDAASEVNKKYIESLSGFQKEISLISPDNQKTPVLVSTSLLHYSNGSLQGVICIIQDLSERKQLEDRLLQARKLESVGQLAAGVAHEINTPIQYVRDNMIFLRKEFESIKLLLNQINQALDKGEGIDNKLSDKLKSTRKEIDLDYLLAEIPLAIDQTLEGSNTVAKIVNSMKEFSHPGTDHKVFININEALQSTLTVSKNEWKYIAQVNLNLCEPPPMANCFPAELNQAFLNVIVNAAHAIGDKIKFQEKSRTFTGEKGIIGVSTEIVNKSVVIKISDTGCGIPEGIRHKIFDPFFTTKEVGKGTGQGLALAHSSIVEKHAGKISFETVLDKGTTFIIELPLE